MPEISSQLRGNKKHDTSEVKVITYKHTPLHAEPTAKNNYTNIIFDNILSDEGGRFYQCQVRCVISLVDYKIVKTFPDNYIWLSYNQIVEMIRSKRLDIESRLLFACNNIDQIQ